MQQWQSVMAWAAQAAEKAAPAGGSAAQQGQPQAPNFLPLMIGVIAIFMLYQFVIAGPKQKAEAKKREDALNTLGKGDKVVTTAGIHGTIESVDKDKGTVSVKVAQNTVIKFSKAAISSYTKRGEGDEAQA